MLQGAGVVAAATQVSVPVLHQHLLLLLDLQAWLAAAWVVLRVLLLLQAGPVLASELAAAVLGVLVGSVGLHLAVVAVLELLELHRAAAG